MQVDASQVTWITRPKVDLETGKQSEEKPRKKYPCPILDAFWLATVTEDPLLLCMRQWQITPEQQSAW